MRPIVLSKQGFVFSPEPFAAFRCNLGRGERGSAFLPVQGMEMQPIYRVFEPEWVGPPLYEGKDKAAAEQAKAEFDGKKLPARPVRQDPFKRTPTPAETMYRTATLKVVGAELPEGNFRLITTKEKGTKLLVPGRDTSKDVLLFVGEDSGFRGNVELLQSGTTAEIVKVCVGGTAIGWRMEVIARLQPGQTLAINSRGRGADDVVLYTWDGENVIRKAFTKAEWEVVS